MNQSFQASRLKSLSSQIREDDVHLEKQVLMISKLLDTLESLNHESQQLELKRASLPTPVVPKQVPQIDFETWRKRIEQADKALEREENTLKILQRANPSVPIEHTELDMQLSILEDKHFTLKEKYQQISSVVKQKKSELKQYSEGKKPVPQAKIQTRPSSSAFKEALSVSVNKTKLTSEEMLKKQLDLAQYEKELQRLQAKKQLLLEKNATLKSKAMLAVQRFSKLQEVIEENKILARQLNTLQVVTGAGSKYDDWESATDAEMKVLKSCLKKGLTINDPVFLKEAGLYT